MPEPPELPLAGGNFTPGVVRVGDTVRRPRSAVSPAVDALLVHLERAGFDGAPRFLGVDASGRTVLEYIPGETSADPGDLDEEAVARVGALVRAFHDATAGFVPPRGAAWQVGIAPDREELVCHHDLGPWNLVRGAGRLAFVDWDGAGPGSRAWDLAYAAIGLAPLVGGDGDRSGSAGRIAALADGYRLELAGRRRLAELLAPRAASMAAAIREGAAAGVAPWDRLLAEGHAAMWQAAAEHANLHRSLWSRALGC